MAGFRIEGDTSGNVVEVNNSKQLKVITETDSVFSASNIGNTRVQYENDPGRLTGNVLIASPEVDSDFRLRVSQDLILDEEVFNYVAQNTGKHSYTTTTLANTWAAGQMTTNSGSITTTTTGSVFSTYAYFPTTGNQTLSADFEAGFSAQPTANAFIEFGLGIPGAQTAAPTDGVFFRLTSAGLQGIASNSGTETSTGIFPLSSGTGTWAYQNSKKYQFIVYILTTGAQFWTHDGDRPYLLGSIPLPAGQARMCMSSAVQAFIKHRIVGGAAGSALQGLFGAYNVRLGGSNLTTTVSTQGNRIYGSYQGLSGGTMGTLARTGTITTGNEAVSVAAVPTNTTAALGTGLGGTFWETATLALNTDGIIMSYQVPLGTVSLPGRRLVLRGVYLDSYVQATIVGGSLIKEWFLAFGHTAVSLATAEAAATKAPRRVALPFIQLIDANQVANTLVRQDVSFCDLADAPIFVNPGEFVQLCTRNIGTVATAGTVVHKVTLIFGWE